MTKNLNNYKTGFSLTPVALTFPVIALLGVPKYRVSAKPGFSPVPIQVAPFSSSTSKNLPLRSGDNRFTGGTPNNNSARDEENRNREDTIKKDLETIYNSTENK